MNPFGLLLVAAGVFSLCGAGFDWEWFMNNRKARIIAAVLGRKGARAFYAILGIALVVFGVLVTLGFAHESN